MYEFRVVKGEGWIMICNESEIPTQCYRCSKTLDYPFFFCKYSNIGICKSCDYSSGITVCAFHFKEPHEHISVIDTQRKDFMEKK